MVSLVNVLPIKFTDDLDYIRGRGDYEENKSHFNRRWG